LKPEEFKAKTAEILSSLSDQSKVSTILTELVEDYDKEAIEKTTFKTSAEKLTADNEKLRQANMNLFLKVGEVKTTETKPTTEDKTPKYSDLFDADGNLK
jgi:hypothetical protein